MDSDSNSDVDVIFAYYLGLSQKRMKMSILRLDIKKLLPGCATSSKTGS